MILSYPRSPDLEGGTKRRKAPPRHTRVLSEPVIAQTVSRKIFGRSLLGLRWTRLIIGFACLCLVALLKSAYLPLLPNGMSRTPAPWPSEPDPAGEDQRSIVYNLNRVALDGGSTPQGPKVSSRLLGLGSAPKTDSAGGPRFLTFLPHSGFNNQRIALENAMVLAYILNCTLVAPPIRLGAPLPYRPFNTLERHHLVSAKREPKECTKALNYTPPECVDHRHFTLMPWNDLVDFQPVRNKLGLDILFMHGSETPRQFLQQDLGLPKEVFAFLKDEELYHYRIYDVKHSFDEVRPDSKYRDELHVDSLRKLVDSFPVVHFGTLFGSGRLKLRHPEYVAARIEISRAMTISHGSILDTTRIIRTKIAEFSADGGSYLAVHIRVGDRKFKGGAVATGRAIWWQLITMLGISETTGTELERRFLRLSGKKVRRPFMVDPPVPKTSSQPRFNRSDPYKPHERCISHHPDLGVETSYLGLPLFIASDSSHPRTDLALAIFHATFPCTFVLSDFSEELKSLVMLRRPGDVSPIGHFLLPLVDAVIAGHAIHVIGTQNR